MLPLLNLYKYHLLNDTELRSLTNIKTYKHNSFWIFLILFRVSSLEEQKNKISIKQVKALKNRAFFFCLV